MRPTPSRASRVSHEQRYAEAVRLGESVGDDVIASAVQTSAAYAAAQNQTVASIRTRAATVLSSAAVVVTFSSAVGLVANDPTHGGVRLALPVALGLLLVVVGIGVLTLYVQWPHAWTFTSGTDVFATGELVVAQRAAFVALEVAVIENRIRIDSLLSAFRWSVALLGLETVLVLIGILLS